MEAITHNRDRCRFELRRDGEVIGYLEYEVDGEVASLTSTRVEPAFEGQGLGSRLVRFALDDIASEGRWHVQPVCPYVARWIALHPAYAPLLVTSPTS